ncbi:MAG: type VI secretion system lipoprotein TssJ [Planctomycetota bacterium]
MKKQIKMSLILLAFFLLCSCAGISRKSDYGYTEKSILLSVKSDLQLNLYQGKPHTLVLCVYQLRDPNSFNQIMDEDDGLSKLLDGSRFDNSVSSAKKIVVHPGIEVTEPLDRADGAKYVCVVAGYFYELQKDKDEIQKDQIVRLFPVPLSMFTKQPKKFDIHLLLGPQEIKSLEVN